MVKWGGTVASVVLLVLWILGGWWSIRWVGDDGDSLTIGGGEVAYQHYPRLTGVADIPGCHVWRHSFGLAWGLQGYRFGDNWAWHIPLWPVPSMALLITAVAWRFDVLARRRARLNLCPRCNYDRTGLAAGVVCPECGTASP